LARLLRRQLVQRTRKRASDKQLCDERIACLDAQFHSAEIISVDKGEDKEQDRSEFFVDRLVLSLVLVISPSIQQLAYRLQYGDGPVKEQQDIQRRRLPCQMSTQGFQRHRVLARAQPPDHLRDALGNRSHIPIHMLQLISKGFDLLWIRQALLHHIVLRVSPTSRQCLHWDLSQEPLYALLCNQAMKTARKAEVLSDRIREHVVGAVVVKHGREGGEGVCVHMAERVCDAHFRAQRRKHRRGQD